MFGVLIAVVAYFYPRAQADLCNRLRCVYERVRKRLRPSPRVYLCGVDPATEAAKACKVGYQLKGKPQSKGAAKCGANTYTYICSNNGP